jgi:hypothetical protein
LLGFSRTSLTEPPAEIRTIFLSDDPSDYSPVIPDYFDDWGFLFNVVLETGLMLEVATSTQQLETGAVFACGFGSLALSPGPVSIAIESVTGAREGEISITLSDIAVAGYTEEYGVIELPACDGTVEITINGAYEHDPG